jgi:hypothetical protein
MIKLFLTHKLVIVEDPQDHTPDLQTYGLFQAELRTAQGTHIIASASYIPVINTKIHRARRDTALFTIKQNALAIGREFYNLSEFEPCCPNCSTTHPRITSQKNRRLRCQECETTLPAYAFYSGGITHTKLQEVANHVF